MIMPQRMSKLFLVGTKSSLEKVTSELHELKVAHIIEHKKDEFDICPPLSSLEKVSSLLVQVRALISHLGVQSTPHIKRDIRLASLEKEIVLIKKEVSGIADKIKKAEDGIALADMQQKILKLMLPLNVSPHHFTDSVYIKSYFGYVNEMSIKESLEHVSKNFEIYAAEQGKNTLIALFADSRHADQFEKILESKSFSSIDISVVKGLEGYTNELIGSISKKREKLEAELASQKNNLKETAKKYATYLADAERFLAIEAEKAQVPLSFGSTKETFFVKCYLPEEDVENVKSRVMKTANNKVYIVEEPVEESEGVPIKLNNPASIRSFEFFTRLYSLPKYDEFDPTFLMALTFPLFFGFMLGDVGYGLITLAFFYFLKGKYPAGRYFFNILMVSSVAAVIFGIIYGEVFGYELWHGIIARTHDANALMLISVIAGAVQINFGLLLGFVLELRHLGLLEAAYKKLSWVLLQVSGLILYASYKNIIGLPVYLGYALLALSIFMLVKGEGFMGILEIPSIVSHTVSYARLMAIGLASVFIAVMVNSLATLLFHKGVLFMPLAIISLLIGHLFNIALGILSPTLHSIRLHYVEFFTKFYSGGGIEYAPFGAEKQKSIF